MGELADLLQPRDLTARPEPAKALMVGEVLDVSPLTVTVREFDGGRHSYQAFGYFPDVSPGDPVRVAVDSRGQFVVMAWEPA